MKIMQVLDLHDLPFFHSDDLIHLSDGFVGQLLHLFGQDATIILTDEAVLL